MDCGQLKKLILKKINFSEALKIPEKMKRVQIKTIKLTTTSGRIARQPDNS